MRIITKKEEQEIESVIVAILKTVDMKEIEIDDKLFLSKDEIRAEHTINHTTIIKLVEKG